MADQTPGAPAGQRDPRRSVPRTDAVLADPRLVAAGARLGRDTVKGAVRDAQERVRTGDLPAAALTETVLATLPAGAGGLRPVLNATGVLLHTNLGRAALSAAAVEAMAAAAGPTDVELDLSTGRRAQRGRAALSALAAAVPPAEAVHVVNNGAAALHLAASVLAAGREVVVSRGELVEIGDGFRLPDLLAASGARLREVGTTNRTTLADYRGALGQDTAFVLKVHPSNFVVSGFTAAVPVAELTGLGVPLVVDIGSGLLSPHPRLPDEPDATTTLRAGADLVTASGDKLLGGPQAGLLLGRRQLVKRLRRHPVARALRVDKLTLAALAASIAGPLTPTARALATDPTELRQRAERASRVLRDAGIEAEAVGTDGEVGGGGAPGLRLASAAVRLPVDYADRLRLGEPPVVGRVAHGACLLDLLAVAPEDDPALVEAVRAAAGQVPPA